MSVGTVTGTSYTGPASSRPVTPMTAGEPQDMYGNGHTHKVQEGYDVSEMPMHEISEKAY